MVEIWRDIEGYEGLYQVSSLGRVKLLDYRHTGKERIMKVRRNNGYLIVGLCRDGKQKTFKVHRLVATAFISNPENLPQINHKDEDKTNNIVENLEWCSAKYNCNYGIHNKKISEMQTNHPNKSKKVLCIETGKIYPSTRQVERDLGFNNGYISRCCLGEYKSAYGYTWRYID